MDKIKKSLIIFVLGAFILVFMLNTNKQSGLKSADDSSEALKAYEDLLRGLQKANYIDGYIGIDELISSEREPNINYDTKYSLFDVNGDKLPELQIRSRSHYFIITYRNGDLYVWQKLTPYYESLNNGAFLHTRPGGTPTHVRYIYIIFNYSGDEMARIYFEKYDQDENDVYDENDKYFFESIEVSFSEWNELTEKYLSQKSDLVVWKEYSKENIELF